MTKRDEEEKGMSPIIDPEERFLPAQANTSGCLRFMPWRGRADPTLTLHALHAMPREALRLLIKARRAGATRDRVQPRNG